MEVVDLVKKWGLPVLALFLIGLYFIFQTGPEPNKSTTNAKEFTFAFVGHTRPNEIGRLHPGFETILRNLKEKNVSLLLLAGDTILGMRTKRELQDNEWNFFEQKVRSYVGGIPILIAPGNHDYCSDVQRESFIEHWGSAGQAYRTYDVNTVNKKIRFIVLDTVGASERDAFKDCWAGGDISGEQMEFLKRSLQGDNFDYYFVALGHFKFIDQNKSNYWFQNMHPLFVKNKTLVFAGDQVPEISHDYFEYGGVAYYASGLPIENSTKRGANEIDYIVVSVGEDALKVETIAIEPS